jgi:hypothetical protein
MGGHLDDAELTLERPIVSITVGSSAIFLMGKADRNVSPIAIRVRCGVRALNVCASCLLAGRSGDCIVMGGESRLCYHGVPLIIPDFEPEAVLACLHPGLSVADALAAPMSELRPDDVRDEDCEDRLGHVLCYLSKGRINFNARQVQGERPEQRFATVPTDS